MDSTTQRKHENTAVTPIYITPYVQQEDEIALIDLWRIVVKRKVVVLGTTLVCFLASLLYILIVTPVYRTDVRLLPPLEQNIQSLVVKNLNDDKDRIEKFTPEYVYNEFTKNLKSLTLRREFFDANGILDFYRAKRNIFMSILSDLNPDVIFDKYFNANLTVYTDNEDKRFKNISFEFDNAELSAHWLNKFVDFVNQRTVSQLYDNVITEINSKIQRLQEEINIKLKIARQRREDSIVQLEEALKIAKSLDLDESAINSVSIERNNKGITVNTAPIPDYMRGVKALQAEIGTLKSRESDAPFIEGLRDLEEQLTLMRNIKIDRNSLLATTIDQYAVVPDKPYKPNKPIVVMLSIIVGVALGIIVIIGLEFKSKERQNRH